MSTTAKRPASGHNGTGDGVLGMGRFFHKRGEVSQDGRSITHEGGRGADSFYRDRWSHDKVVRSTHGVNCTGSCSWKVYVKDGIITWEAQQTDYPTTGDDSPEYEPRGCPRGASFSWYTYSPTRVRYPYARGVLLSMYREAKEHYGDPVEAWASIVEDPEKSRTYKRARGKGGLVRTSWEEAVEIAAAAHVYTTKKYGPDRLAGFSVIPAMSQISYAAGTRFYSLVGGTVLSFYDWYADLPPASPQMFGDQTDVPESADWWNSAYLMMWGSNVPVTRTPDAHFMAEVRYRGTKVVSVSPDFADNAKFADEWVAVHPGTDAAMAIAMGHVILKEFFVEQPTKEFIDYTKTFSDLPFLVQLERRGDAFVPGKFLVASDLTQGDWAHEDAASENADFKTVLMAPDGGPVVPNGSMGFRYGDSGKGKWNLDLQGLDPVLSVMDVDGSEEQTYAVEVELPRFDTPGGQSDVLRRGVPVREVAGRPVCTVYDLMLANYGVAREGMPGTWPESYDDPSQVGTPEWQESFTGVPAVQCIRIAREFATTARDSGGRCMIIMGAGTNHWFHSDTIYRTFLTLTTLTGCQGKNGGGWAHYVGQEKVRPQTGFAQMAFALDWQRPARQNISAAFFYLHTGQWRYDSHGADVLSSATGKGLFQDKSPADLLAASARMGWMPSYPTLSGNILDHCDAAKAEGITPQEYVLRELQNGNIRFVAEDPDGEGNCPKVLTIWRSNLLGSSSKGNEYFNKILLGADNSLRAQVAPEGKRGSEVRWNDDLPEGKLDMVLTLDFRMTSTTLFSDIVLPAATWYEKHDLSTTDMHPFVHAFNPAINPPWQTRTDYATFGALAEKFSELARVHLGTRTDMILAPLQHDTPDQLAYSRGVVKDWRHGECEPVPGKTMPKMIPIERDYTAIAQKWGAIGPLAEKLGMPTKGVVFDPTPEIDKLRHHNGTVRGGAGAGRPSLARDRDMGDAILHLSGTTNGRLATEGWKQVEARTGKHFTDLSEGEAGHLITFRDTQERPQPVITSPEWSGSEHGGRRYSAFVVNVERLKPWHTLTGRPQFYIDHDWLQEIGESLPVFRPPLNLTALYGEPGIGQPGADGVGITVRYLTPHNKWSIHSEYQDNLLMLSLARGGQVIWMSVQDAAKCGIADNDWIEAVNRNGVVAARAIVSSRMPEGLVYMHHAQDRTIDVPIAEASGKRGGIHNSITRVMFKPSHVAGGYAQISWAFNYYGPTGNNRDEVTVIRRRSQDVTY